MEDKILDEFLQGEETMKEKILQELKEIKKELQDIRSILEPKKTIIEFIPEDSNRKHNDTSKKCVSNQKYFL